MLRRGGWSWVLVCSLAAAGAAAAPPTPSGPHPRLFLGGASLAAAKANAARAGSASKAIVDRCQQTIDNPGSFVDRGGADGDTWPAAAVACAFAYLVTGNAAYAAQGIKYWNASLNDDQTLGDGAGCVAGVNTSWQTWNGNPPAPPVIVTVTHDTGYPMRWYGPYIALTYDWLHDAPGVDDALRAHARTCLIAWVDYYTQRGYHNDEAGANYNAGFVAGKTMAAVALGGDAGADGDRLWTETVDGVFGSLLVGQGLAGRTSPLGMPAGVLVGGDWGEGWQYGPLSVLEYAAAARVVEESGAPQPEMDEWTNAIIVRYIHGTVPALDGQYVGGDFDSGEVYQSPSMNVLDAVLIGPSSDAAAAWAAKMKELQSPNRSTFIWNALAEIRAVTPADYRAQSPAPPLWYIARGTRNVYARTGWDAGAYWAVFSSPPQVSSDHHHFAAGNFVFSRGADHLVVDPSNYGEPGTLETNAAGADSPGVTGAYAPSQTGWSEAELLWARGTNAAVYAARGDFAKAFKFSSTPSDIPYAHREWAFLPEGEIVTIDRVHTRDSSHFMYLNFHTNTGGTLAFSGPTAIGAVGGSKVAIHPVVLGGGTPSIFHPQVTNTYSYPCGACTNARFAVDDYTVKVPGPGAVAIHVIDGLGAAEDPALVGSLNDDNFDPPPKQNAGVIGAAVYRGSKQTFVVASSGADGQVGATMTYGIPGGSASRHIVFDAPEDASGKSVVSASAMAGRCVIQIVAGAGFAGRPLMFSVVTAGGGCAVSEDTNVPPGGPPPGGGVVPGADAGPGGPGVGPKEVVGGCSLAPASPPPIAALVAIAWLVARRRRRRT
ncbi:MAG TPA: hypothetical protein VKE22_19635 [Haliangiales bacterium]|nr:hypothetical protein [Haliangiales bacterium]